MTAFKAIAIAGLPLLLWITPAPAQDWLKRSQDLLRDLTREDRPASLDSDQITRGLREALTLGSESVVGRLGRKDGFNNDPVAHIPLPETLAQSRELLSRLGLGAELNDLELKLNRAAEQAVPKAQTLFMNAIQNMSLTDARSILKGPNDAATRYFEKQMGPQLKADMRPLVDDALGDVGAIRSWENLTNGLTGLPFVPNLRSDLSTHVLDKANAAVFQLMAKEEAAIRHDPAARTSEILRAVFGAQ